MTKQPPDGDAFVLYGAFREIVPAAVGVHVSI